MKVIPWVFALAIGWGAALLFACQPMLTKLILPSYGGSPSVWATATFLFQLLLLVGYAVVHVTVKWLDRRQLPAHLVVVLLPLLALPLALPADVVPSADGNPVWWLIRSLLIAVGLPFVVLATTGPVLQIWYSWTGLPDSHDPYVLYAASNAGSLVGLLAYPFVIEWTLPLSSQTRWWSIGYVAYAALIVGCGVIVLAVRRGQYRVGPSVKTAQVDTHGAADAGSVDIRRRLRWLFWAFLPAGVSLGVTTHLTTDVAAIPLLWVMPLALYLLTFIISFGRRDRVVSSWPVIAATVLALASLVLASPRLQMPVALAVVLGLALVFCTGLAGHSRLATDRPGVQHLTGFYLVVSLGGLVGGLVNGVLAPLVLSGPWEYPLQMALVPLLAVGLVLPRPVARVLARFGVLGWIAEAVLVVAVFVLASVLGVTGPWAAVTAAVVGLAWLTTGLMIAVGGRRFAVMSASLLVVASMVPLVVEDVIWRDRTFFGSYEVTVAGDRHTLRHGTTIHGWQQWPDGSADLTPTTYYSRSGPLGDIMGTTEANPERSLGFIGLGIGTALSYVRPTDSAQVVEIDPAMVGLADDTRWFTYLTAARPNTEVLVGDGRIVLRDQLSDASFDVLVVDAFSSDAIPIHLLTREALALYLDRTADDGVVALHLSNRHLDLVPVTAELARDADAYAAARIDNLAEDPNSTPSSWVVISRNSDAIEKLRASGWDSLDGVEGPLWTDDYSSLVTVLR